MDTSDRFTGQFKERTFSSLKQAPYYRGTYDTLAAQTRPNQPLPIFTYFSQGLGRLCRVHQRSIILPSIDEVTNDVTCLHSGRPLLLYAG